VKSQISWKDTAYLARESLKRRPIKLLPPEGVEDTSAAPVPSDAAEQARKAPPRVLKPSALNDQCVAPTPDLESHRKRLRAAFGNTMSDEFVEVLLGKLVEALRPGSLEALEEPTVNAALAIIDSMCPQSELEALLAVQIIAAGFSGLRLLRQSQQHMTQDYIDTYGNYAIKLLRLQNEMIQTFDRYRRGNKQTVEVRHVHIHSGAQGVVGIINPADDRAGRGPPGSRRAAETAGSGQRADPEAPGSAGEIDPGPAQSAPCGGGAGEGAVSFDQEPIGGHDEGVVGIINPSDDRDGGGRE
jgi:hypothetical protein